MSGPARLLAEARRQAREFLETQTQFHLGFLPTESSHPKTRDFSATVARDRAAGAAQLLSVDLDLPPVAERVFAGVPFARLVQAVERCLEEERRIAFSGCGATGRLAIVLEKMWRVFWERAARELPARQQSYRARADRACSIMTGGDRALIRSVENFEDYQSFGRRQVRDAALQKGDLLVAVSEGGETSSVIGTAKEARERDLSVFFAFNNPAKLLAERVQRSRELIEDPGVVVLELCTGPMALSGSTRLQATTMEMLVIGAALELACAKQVAEENPGYDGPLAPDLPVSGYPEGFRTLVQDLSGGAPLAGLAALIELEEEAYRAGARVTYLCGEYLLDLVSDTTERTPTFMIPPFRRFDDRHSPPSWAFAKDPRWASRQAWNHMLGRLPRGLEWGAADYRAMGGSEAMITRPPKLDREEIYAYAIGGEPDPSRWQAPGSVLLAVKVGGAGEPELERSYREDAARYSRAQQVNLAFRGAEAISVPAHLRATPMELFTHLAVKLLFNTLSTATMGRLGRIRGNWMIQVDATNKKLVDRATRIIAELAGLPYEEACLELHRTMVERRARRAQPKVYQDSFVVQTLKRLGRY